MAKTFGQTPSQTVGPFFAYGLTPEQYGYAFSSIAGPVTTTDKAITISGRVFDGDGQTIPDALVEIWQADTHVFGRCGTGSRDDHRFIFDTARPQALAPDHAPHISVIVFMRGLLMHGFTRIYFADNADANAQDAVLRSVPANRRHTLIAMPDPQHPDTYLFDIHMQGAEETVFFDL